MDTRTVFIENGPRNISNELMENKVSKSIVILDTLCENYKEILIHVSKIC